MVDGVKGWKFNRGLDNDFMSALDVLRKSNWFAEVLADKDLLLGIRDNYLDIYRYGQRLFQISRVGAELKVTTHPKYLVDPDLYRDVAFDGERFVVADAEPLIEYYKADETLEKMKRAAAYYAGDEKKGVHRIVRENPNVLDVEIAFGRERKEAEPGVENESKRQSNRIDIACLEKEGDRICLRFWEVKRYANHELFSAAGDAKVVGQIESYRKYLRMHRDDVIDSYKRVAANILEMCSWVPSNRKVGDLVRKLATCGDLCLDDDPFVGLVVFGYDDAQQNGKRFKTHITKLRNVIHRGDANIQLVAGKARRP